MARPEKSADAYHTRVFERRRAEAEELGLWRQPATLAGAERRREELAALGFHDWNDHRWERMVATLRAAKAERAAPEPGE